MLFIQVILILIIYLKEIKDKVEVCVCNSFDYSVVCNEKNGKHLNIHL